MREGPTDSESESDDEEKKLGFSLPPISLPPLRFPRLSISRIPISLPYPRRPKGIGSYLLAGIAIDGLDIIAYTAGYHELPRVIVGAVLSVIVFGPIGVSYVWEAIPVLASWPFPTLAPTAVVIAFVTHRVSEESR
jgi:hypothetical protein